MIKHFFTAPFLCLKFSTYRKFSGKSKKFRLVIGIFWEKAIFIGYRWKNNKGTKSVDTIRFLHHSGASPFGGCATTFAPQVGALWVLGIIVNW